MDNLDILQALYNIIINMIQRGKVECYDKGCFTLREINKNLTVGIKRNYRYSVINLQVGNDFSCSFSAECVFMLASKFETICKIKTKDKFKITTELINNKYKLKDYGTSIKNSRVEY